MDISDIGKAFLSDSIVAINKEIEDLDHTLSPLIEHRDKLNEQIEALVKRREDLIQNSSNIDKDLKGA